MEKEVPMLENILQMVSNSLGLESPWSIQSVKFNEEELELHIEVGVDKDAAIACPVCGGSTKRYGYEPTERIWRHGDCFFFPSYVHCRRPRIQCDKCGVKQVNAPFERKNSRFTQQFESYAMLILADMPMAKASKLLRCNEKSLVSMLRYWVGKAESGMDLSGVAKLAIDETSFKRGHNYVTLIIDAAKRSVIDVQKGREAGTVTQFAAKLAARGGSSDNIKAVTSDMAPPYLSAVSANFPNAEHTIDKFHVKKEVLSALDDVRKEEQSATKRKKELFVARRLFMIPTAKLSDVQAADIAALSKRYPLTGRAYRIVSGLDDFYASRTVEEADTLFHSLYSWMRRCRLNPMKKVAETLMRHKDNILSYFNNRLTNAICEGINSMVQAMKRKARGYHTFESYAAIIYLVAGKLTLDTPKLF